MEIENALHLGRRGFLNLLLPLAGSVVAPKEAAADGQDTLYVVCNMHGDSLGWLAPYYVERNFGLYSYLDHQDLAVKDPNYSYVFSEIPHAITMMEYEPQRFEELKTLIRQGRVEMANAFATEATVNLSGGEALVMQVVEGLRWYKNVMNLRPHFAYCIDVTGWHEQMAQIVAGTELEAFIYCRYNPTIEKRVPEDPEMFRGGDPLHWIESPDGTRALAISPGHYTGGFAAVMRPDRPLPDEKLKTELARSVQSARDKWKRFPKGTPMMVFAGQADYSLSFNYKGYPKELLEVWDASGPDVRIKFSTLSAWFDAIKPALDSGKYQLRTVTTGSKLYGFNSFWVLAPRMKQWYRRSEHACQASEALAAIASLKSGLSYPSQDLGNAWFLLALNLDRGPLWGICVSGVFVHDKSWDVRDRYELADSIARNAAAKALPALLGKGKDTLGLYNPVNWDRDELFELALPEGRTPKDAPAQLLEDGKTTLVRMKLPSMGVRSLALRAGAPQASNETKFPETFETRFYTARVDPNTGALVSLKLKPSGREVLGGPSNVVFLQDHIPAVKPQKPQRHYAWAAHFLLDRSQRVTLATSNDRKPALRVRSGPLATILEITSPFPGGDLRRTVRFYRDSPRIDFITETNDIPSERIVGADFQWAGEVAELRRGIPYGFSRGNHAGVVPVIRWSHYTLSGGGGAAILDRGVPARELADSIATIFLHLAIDHYYWDEHTDWMSGKGRQTYQYALIAHEGPWEQARIPQLAFSYNAPPLAVPDVGQHNGESYVETSGNVIIEALRRVEDEIEIRMVESFGARGRAVVKVKLPHQAAAMTNMLGRQRAPLEGHPATGNAREYRFEVRPQQIVTLRLKTRDAVAPIRSVTTFDPLIPEHKRAFTRSYKHPEFKAYPPREASEMWKWQGGQK